MKNRLAYTSDKPAADPTSAPMPIPTPSSAGLVRSWTAFWFTPIDPVGLHALRVLAGLLFLSWLLTFAGHQEDLCGLGGWFDRQAYREMTRIPEGAPVPAGWSLLHLCDTNAVLLKTAYWLSVVVLLLFTAGIWVRITAVLTWLAVASFIGNPAISYGPDYLLGIVAFYLMVGYLLLGQWSWPQSTLSHLLGPRDAWLFGSRSNGGSSCAANLAVRLLQVHFAIVLVVSGLHKLQFGDWWAGVAFWYPLNPPFSVTAESLRTWAPHADANLFVMSLAQYVLLAWQIGFPLFAWRKRWRPVLLGGAVLGWAGSVFLYREPVFGPVLCLGCLSFLTAAEWRWLLGGLLALGRLVRPARWSTARAEEPMKVGAKS